MYDESIWGIRKRMLQYMRASEVYEEYDDSVGVLQWSVMEGIPGVHQSVGNVR